MKKYYVLVFILALILIPTTSCQLRLPVISNTTNEPVSTEAGSIEPSKTDSVNIPSPSIPINESGPLNYLKWDGSVAKSLSKGSGTLEDPYVITTPSELAFLSQSCRNGNTFCEQFIELGCDIDLNGKEWKPIGTHTVHGLTGTTVYYDFEGQFDGKGHKIRNFIITEAEESSWDEGVYYGFFGSIYEASICNLIIEDYLINLTSDKLYVGGLVGWCEKTCLIENCHSINGRINVSFIEYEADVGGLIGYIYGSSLSPNCTIVRNSSSNNIIQVNCLVRQKAIYMTVHDGNKFYETRSMYSVGGLIGVDWAENATVYNCVSSGSISVYVDAVDDDLKPLGSCSIGGFAAVAICRSIRNCYSTTSIFLNKDFGLDELGGFIGLCEETWVSNCFSTGSIELQNQKYKVVLGGFIGRCEEEANVFNCFVDAAMKWSLTDEDGNYFIGKQQEYLRDIVSNCFVSSSSTIKNIKPTGDNELYRVVSTNSLKDKEFLKNELDFEEYDVFASEDPFAVTEYSGWIINDGAYPTLFFEKEVFK